MIHRREMAEAFGQPLAFDHGFGGHGFQRVVVCRHHLRFSSGIRDSDGLCFIKAMSLLTVNENGLYCPAGDLYIDPWQPVDFAVVTHAHSDHARAGSRHYITAETGKQLLQERL